MSIPRSISSDLNEEDNATIASAFLYKNNSRLSNIFIRIVFRIASTAIIDAGQISRNSKIKGRRRRTESNHPESAVKNWGDVATITSGFFWKSPAVNPEIIKVI